MNPSPFMSLGCRLFNDTRGSFSVLSAASFPFCVAAAVLSIDMGSWYVERRDVQSIVDLAAMAAADHLDTAEEAAKQTISNNGLKNLTSVIVTRGQYSANPKIVPEKRFIANRAPYNAVRVEAAKPGSTYFAHAIGLLKPQIKVSGLAARKAEAAFSLGSRLASVRDGIGNAALRSLLNTDVSLNAMDYRALADANVSLGSFMNALATQLRLTAGSYSDVLNASATSTDLLHATAAVLQRQGDTLAAAAVFSLLAQTSGQPITVPLASWIDLGSLGTVGIGQSAAGLDAALNVLAMITSAASIANGDHQVVLDLGATVPGLLSVKIEATVGDKLKQSPWVRVGQPEATLRTAQTRLRLLAEIAGSGLLANTRIRLPIAVDAASAEATLQKVTCSGSARSVEISAKPGIAKAYIGEITSSNLATLGTPMSVTSATLVSTLLLKVVGKAAIEAGSSDAETLEFSSTEIAAGTVKTAETSTATTSLVTSLVQTLSLDVQALGIGLATPAAIKAALLPILKTAAVPLDAVLSETLSVLGVHLGEADVRVNGVRCSGSALAG